MNAEGLHRVLQAAVEEGLEPAGITGVRVVELDAYASVADMIQAAITANKGAASLSQIYAMCEVHGRIALRQGGSRIITANQHWKSQIRHALYTGQRFERIAQNSEYWQLDDQIWAGRAPKLVTVVVRALSDDPDSNIFAVSGLHQAAPQPVVASAVAKRYKPRAKPSKRAPTEIIGDNSAGDTQQRSVRQRGDATNSFFVDATDNHSTQAYPSVSSDNPTVLHWGTGFRSSTIRTTDDSRMGLKADSEANSPPFKQLGHRDPRITSTTHAQQQQQYPTETRAVIGDQVAQITPQIPLHSNEQQQQISTVLQQLHHALALLANPQHQMQHAAGTTFGGGVQQQQQRQ